LSPRVSAEHKERRRQAILDAALEVFIGKGYQVSTIDDIASRSHLSVGAIYRYFHNKGDIMLSLVEERLGRTPILFERLTEKAGNPHERLRRCVDLFTSALRVRHPATGRLLLVTLAEAVQDGQVRRGLQERFGSLVRYISGIIRSGMEEGHFRRDIDPDALAALLLCTADGSAIYWVTDTPQIDMRGMRTTMLEMLDSYLTPKE
jgi:AcrR family transcriptional regulator